MDIFNDIKVLEEFPDDDDEDYEDTNDISTEDETEDELSDQSDSSEDSIGEDRDIQTNPDTSEEHLNVNENGDIFNDLKVLKENTDDDNELDEEDDYESTNDITTEDETTEVDSDDDKCDQQESRNDEVEEQIAQKCPTVLDGDSNENHVFDECSTSSDSSDEDLSSGSSEEESGSDSYTDDDSSDTTELELMATYVKSNPSFNIWRDQNDILDYDDEETSKKSSTRMLEELPDNDSIVDTFSFSVLPDYDFNDSEMLPPGSKPKLKFKRKRFGRLQDHNLNESTPSKRRITIGNGSHLS